MQNTYNTLYCIFCIFVFFYVFVGLIPHFTVTMSKYWICEMHDVYMYIFNLKLLHIKSELMHSSCNVQFGKKCTLVASVKVTT
jgi:hypothetical protein